AERDADGLLPREREKVPEGRMRVGATPLYACAGRRFPSGRGGGGSTRGAPAREAGPEMSCVRPVSLFQAMATAGTMVIVEYVPASTPMSRIHANSWITLPPKSSSAMRTTATEPEVRMVRDSVWFMARLSCSSKVMRVLSLR